MSVNPKANLIRTACKAVAVTFRRGFGEASRTLVHPSATVDVRNELETSVQQIIVAELGKTKLPVVQAADATPDGPHWLVEPLGGQRNFLHGRLPVSTTLAYVDADGTCSIGAVYFPVEDVLVLAEKGTGAIGPERLRVSGRADLKNALLLLPVKTEDVVNLGLMDKAAKASLHTRKTGHTLFDMIDVAAGRADVAIATRVTRLEALLAGLIVAESGGAVTDITGAPVTPSSTTLLATSLKLHAPALALFGTQ